jgi:hypothetical protein
MMNQPYSKTYSSATLNNYLCLISLILGEPLCLRALVAYFFCH